MQKGNVVRSAVITASAIGAAAVIAAVHGMRIRVLGLSLSSAGINNVKFQSGSIDLTGLFYLIANSQITLPLVNDDDDTGWFETIPGQALNINLSANLAVGGVVTFKMLPTG